MVSDQFGQVCPDCGHAGYQHGESHYWPDGRCCTKCSSNPGGLVGNPGNPNPCCLTSGEVRQAIAAGSPACPNHDDPVLCKWDRDLGRIVPEAGCPLHDLALRPQGDYADYTEGFLDR